MSEKALKLYTNELIRWNKAINLVSPKTINDIDTRHIKDSEQLAQYIPHNKTLMDWGSGGGLPAMVIAIVRPDLSVHMVESDSKKSEFLRHVSRETSVPAQVHNCRIEALECEAIKPDIITARALASLTQLITWMTPFRTLNSNLEGLFLKGEHWKDEVQEALETYRFDYETYPSETDKKARIIHIKNLT